MKNSKKVIFYVINLDRYFLSHKLPLGLHALKSGYDVYVLTTDTGHVGEFTKYGIHFINIPFRRSITNLLHELKCVFLLIKAYHKYKPAIIHHMALKPIVFGSLAAGIAGCKNVVNSVNGFGYVFSDNRKGIIQRLIKSIFFMLLRNKYYYVVQNLDDFKILEDTHLIESSHLILIKGSGINLDEYTYSEAIKTDYVKLLFPSRMLRDKGVLEFIQAAKLLRDITKEKARFILAGDCDEGNFATMKKNELLELMEDGFIEWIGHQKNMFEIYKSCAVIVLPSYYREGLPKALIEAAAVGRPIITTDMPGCKECVIHGFNGYLVPAKNVPELAKAMLTLINDYELRLQMGKNSRILAEKEFSIEYVINSTFDLYNKIFNKR
jgi:glycosyltransferase involved in cell wall biosynthesis